MNDDFGEYSRFYFHEPVMLGQAKLIASFPFPPTWIFDDA